MLLAMLPGSCASVDPAAPADGVRLACIGLADPDCTSVATTAMSRVPGAGTIVAVVVEAYPCDVGQCPPGFEDRKELSITVELVDPARIHQFGATTMFTGDLTISSGLDAVSTVVSPASTRTGTDVDPFTTGHCGLGSPIDADGSLWDPIGSIDARMPGLVGDVAGRFVLTGDRSARFVTATGFGLNLLRRDGPKSYLGCD